MSNFCGTVPEGTRVTEPAFPARQCWEMQDVSQSPQGRHVHDADPPGLDLRPYTKCTLKMAGEALPALLTVSVQGVAYYRIGLGSGLNFIYFNRFALQ